MVCLLLYLVRLEWERWFFCTAWCLDLNGAAPRIPKKTYNHPESLYLQSRHITSEKSTWELFQGWWWWMRKSQASGLHTHTPTLLRVELSKILWVFSGGPIFKSSLKVDDGIAMISSKSNFQLQVMFHWKLLFPAVFTSLCWKPRIHFSGWLITATWGRNCLPHFKLAAAVQTLRLKCKKTMMNLRPMTSLTTPPKYRNLEDWAWWVAHQLQFWL